MADNKITVGNIENVSGEGNIAGRDVIKNITTIHQRALTAAEEASGQQKAKRLQFASGVRKLVQGLSDQAGSTMEGETPYKGLLAYGMYEPEIFYGRSKANKDLLNLIKRGPLVVLHGESSVGKTSLLQAGIGVSLIAAGHLAIPLRTRASDPVDVIKAMIMPEINYKTELTQASLREFLREYCLMLGPKVNLCLLMDQFEEFFDLLTKEERRPFLESLADCLNDPILRVRWVLAVRREAFSSLAELEAYGIHPFQNTYRLDRLSRAEAGEAILEPARNYGIALEAQLVDHILDTLIENGEVRPTNLQLVCSALVEHLPENKTLTLAHYEKEGGTPGILSNYLKRQIEYLPAEEQDLAWKVLGTLVTSNHRRVVRTYDEIIQELESTGVGRRQIDVTLEMLTARRVLFRLPVTPKTFELAHEYLVQQIDLDPDYQARKAAQELLDYEVGVYQRYKTLLREDRLKIIGPYMRVLRISPEAQELLAASQAAIQQEKAERELQQQRLVELAAPTNVKRLDAAKRAALPKYKKYALIIGNDVYDDNHFAPLQTPEQDVAAFVELLHDPKIGGFEDVKTLVNQSSFEIEAAIADFCADRRRDELMLVYFSGHGILDEQGRLFLAAKNTRHDRPRGRAIQSQFITENMDASLCKRQILILDCCHSGAFHRGTKGTLGRKAITEATFEGKGYGRVVLTATDATEYAWENDQLIGDARNSVFTHFLIDGLKTGAADLDGDGWITIDELYDYVYQQIVSRALKQTPGRWIYRQQGKFFIALNPSAASY